MFVCLALVSLVVPLNLLLVGILSTARILLGVGRLEAIGRLRINSTNCVEISLLVQDRQKGLIDEGRQFRHILFVVFPI